MATSRATTPKPDLFPFLAVLVCTMGALIFLLLAFSARIRESQASASVKEPNEVMIAFGVEVDPPQPDGIASDRTPTSAAPAADKIEPHPLDLLPRVAATPAEVILKTPPAEIRRPTQTQAEVNAPVVAKLADLTAERQRRLDAVDAARAESERLKQQIATQERALAAAMEAADANDRVVAELRQRLVGLEVNLSDLKTALAATEGELADAQSAAATAAKSYRFVTVDRLSGTRRHPIVVVCRSDRWSLPVEGVDISARLNGYTSGSNPLVAAVRALKRHYAGGGEAAYVLLVVPPEGVIAYQQAANILLANHIQFGYEIVPDSLPLTYPRAKPDATETATAAIERVRNSTNRLGFPLPRADTQGRFTSIALIKAKQEFDAARGPSQWNRRAALSRPPEATASTNRSGLPAGTGGTSRQLEPPQRGGTSQPWSDGGEPFATRPQTPLESLGRTGVATEGAGNLQREQPGDRPAGARVPLADSGGKSIAPRSIATQSIATRPNASTPTGSPPAAATADRRRTVAERERVEANGSQTADDDRPQWQATKTTRSNGEASRGDGQPAVATIDRLGGADSPESNAKSWDKAPFGKTRERETARDLRDSRSRLWGRTPTRWLGYERQIALSLAGGDIVSGNLKLEAADGLPTTQLRRMVVELADLRAAEWGPPAGSVFWRPTLVMSLPSTDVRAMRLSERLSSLAAELEMGVLLAPSTGRSRGATQAGTTQTGVRR